MSEPFYLKTGRVPVLRLIGTLVSISLLVYLFYNQGWGEISAAFSQISLQRITLALGLMIISRLAVVSRWHVLLRTAGVNISLAQSMRITFAGLFANNVLPTTVGGDVVRMGAAMRMGFSRAVCVASLMVDRLVGMTGMAMALPFGLQAVITVAGLPAGAESLALGSGLALPRSLAVRMWERGRQILFKLLQALSLWVKRPYGLLGALFFTWIHMACLFSIFWLLLDDMGQAVPFLLIAGLESVSYFVTLLPISINGLGVQEVSIAMLFSVYGGASPESGLTLAILYRTLMMFASLPGALFIPRMIEGEKKLPTYE